MISSQGIKSLMCVSRVGGIEPFSISIQICFCFLNRKHYSTGIETFIFISIDDRSVASYYGSSKQLLLGNLHGQHGRTQT